MLHVVVKRSEWLRGVGHIESYLLRGQDNKRCCIGFACSTAGCADDVLLDRMRAGEVRQQEDRVSLVAAGLLRRYPSGSHHDEHLSELYATNDDLNISEAQREEQLINLGLPLAIEFEFVD